MYDTDTDMEESERRMDRFSELPNSLIHLILSFLPMRDVVKTSLLSKRWKNLWTTVPCLNFCDLLSMEKTGKDETEEVRSFVNRALIFWRGIEIQKFKIDIDWVFGNSFTDVDLWVRFAVEHKVEDLSIHLMYEDGEIGWKDCKKYAYTPPVCLNLCSSLRKLSLVGCNLRLSVSPPWNQLKSLKIHGFTFGESLINCLLLGCPQLEVFDLRIVECYENLNIRSTSLKWLKIEKYLVFEDDKTSLNKVLRIRCPNLETLALSGVLYPRYLFKNISSLTNVTLGFNGTCDYGVGNEMVEETMKQIFTTFQHVDKVALSYWCLQVLAALQMKYPSLPNVKFFPNLKSLVIIQDRIEDSEEFDVSKHLEYEITLFDPNKYLEFETKLSKSFMLQLKTVDITSSLRNTSTYRFIELLLKDASMLEKLVIRVAKFAYPNWFKIAEGLLCMPRSSFAKVIIKDYKKN